MLTGSPSLEYLENWPGVSFVSNIARFITYQKAREGLKTKGGKKPTGKNKHEKTLSKWPSSSSDTQGKYHDETKSSMYGQEYL